jgi:hypothetical protein
VTPEAGGLAALVRRCQAGDGRALAELREGFPGLVPWAALEELARRAREAWAGARGGSAARRAARLRALEKATTRLTRPGAGKLERLLSGRAALAHARLGDLRDLAARAGGGAPAPVVRDLARRVRRAEREAAAADRALRAFQERTPPGS